MLSDLIYFFIGGKRTTLRAVLLTNRMNGSCSFGSVLSSTVGFVFFDLFQSYSSCFEQVNRIAL